MSIEPTTQQLKIINDHGKHYSDKNLANLLGVGIELVPLYREHYRLMKGKRVYVPPPDDGFDCLVAEMRALISIAELTDNPHIRKAAKERLKRLSRIPSNNPFS